MSEVLGPGVWVFFFLTVVIHGGAGWLMGQALAENWRPTWQLIVYSLMLGASDRFLTYALFDGPLLSASGYVVDTAVIGLAAAVAYRNGRVRRITTQYPWLYERVSPFSWRELNNE